jgi:hypothetical protein
MIDKILLFIALSSCLITTVFIPRSGYSKNHSAALAQAVEAIDASQCFFIPPENWDIVDPKTLSPKVKMAFLKNSGKGFCPSINLAVEETDVSLSDYLKAVKAIHEQDRNNHWRPLGKVRTAAGLAQLTEIDSTTEWGPVRILQLILMRDKCAYVLTAAALKEEISHYYQEIQCAFRSLTLSHDLLSAIPQLERREMLKQQQVELFAAAKKHLQSSTQKKNLFEDSSFEQHYWSAFQKTLLDNFGDMGAFWQILFLRNTREKILSLSEIETLPNLLDDTIQK